jgi:hypothetical protein
MKKQFFQETVDIILIAPIHTPMIVNNSNDYFDTYFGDLVSYYLKQNLSVLIVGPEIQNKKGKNSNLYFSKQLSIKSIVDFFFIQNIYSLLISFFKIIFFSDPPKLLYESSIKNIKNLILADFRNSFSNILICSLYEISFINLFKRYPNSKIYHTFENSTWEKSIQISLKKNEDNRSTIGYLHCAVLDSHLKLFMTEEDFQNRPMPDQIICTGLNAKKALLCQGAYPNDKVKDGIALREKYLTENFHEKEAQNQYECIVLLEGLPSMLEFLKVILDSIDEINKKILVRCHPTISLDLNYFRSIKSHKNFFKIEDSVEKNLFIDLTKSNIVLYKGTSAALYAGFMQKKLIRFKDSWWRSDNPLERSPIPIHEFQNSKELFNLLKNSANLYSRENLKDIQTYIKDYITIPSSENIEKNFTAK